MMHIIYKATHKITGQVKYIGITHQELKQRIAGHRSNKKSAMYEDMCKDLLTFDVIDTATDFLEALGKESFYIAKYDTMFPNGANRVKSRRYIEGIEKQQADAHDREKRKLRRRGVIRGFPSLEMPVGSFYAQYRHQRFIDYVTSHKDAQYQSYVQRTETQKGGLTTYFIPSVLFVAPVLSFLTEDDVRTLSRRGADFCLIQSVYQRCYYHERHGEWYCNGMTYSRRPMSSHVWDWIYDEIEVMNRHYHAMRTWDSCPVDLPYNLFTSAPVLCADFYHYAITVDDYLAGRK